MHTSRKTRNNTPGAVPAITHDIPMVISPKIVKPVTMQTSTIVHTQTMYPTIEFTPGPIIIPPYLVPRIRVSERLISQQALNAMTMRKAINAPIAFTPRHFVRKAYEDQNSILCTFCITNGPSNHWRDNHRLQQADE